MAAKVKYEHNKPGIVKAALQSEQVRGLLDEKAGLIEATARALGADDARADSESLRSGWYGRSRGRSYVSRWRRGEARDGILNIALRQARTR